MPNINVNVEVPAAPDKVWALLKDPTRFEEWMTIHTRWDGEPPAETKVGTTMTEVVTMMGMANKITWTVDEYDEDARRLKISGTGMAAVRVEFTLGVDAKGDESVVGIDAGFEGQMIVGPLGEAIAKDARKNLDESLNKLKTLVS